MESQTKRCQNCKLDFTIEPDDFSFYEKIKVPPPTWCFLCRQLRRYAWRNERTLYRRNCDLCGKSTVTIYSPNKPYKVYCNTCWWSDDWDPTFHGRDFDFSKPFFEQFHQLQLNTPRMALLNKNSTNSEYTNQTFFIRLIAGVVMIVSYLRIYVTKVTFLGISNILEKNILKN